MSPLSALPQPSDLDAFLAGYLEHAERLHHPRCLAHPMSTPDLRSGIDGLVNGVVGNPMAIDEMGPSGAAVERAIVNWMLRRIGWPEHRLLPVRSRRRAAGHGP